MKEIKINKSRVIFYYDTRVVEFNTPHQKELVNLTSLGTPFFRPGRSIDESCQYFFPINGRKPLVINDLGVNHQDSTKVLRNIEKHLNAMYRACANE